MGRIRPLPQGVLIDQESWPLLESYNKWWVSKRGDVITQSEKTIEGKRVRTTYRLHRVIMDAPKGMDVDHINHDRLDNRKANLRVCTHAENGRNLSVKRNNTSGIAGVRWDGLRSKWSASIKLNYKEIFLGRFTSLQEASRARQEAEIKYFGAFAPRKG